MASRMESPNSQQATIVLETCSRGTVQCRRTGSHSQQSIWIVALHRPRVKNAVNDDVYEDLLECLDKAEKDDTIAAIVLTGTGSYFSSGADLKGEDLTASFPNGRNSLHRPVGRFMMKLIQFPKLIAAAVNGPAVGIGVTLLFHCDLVYCTKTATFWTPFSRVALVPELCSSFAFPARMGLAKANEMLLLSKEIDAATAVEWNICSRIVGGGVDLTSGDPFHPQSLANYMAQEIDQRLLRLPLGAKSARMYVEMVRGSERRRLQLVCLEELLRLDERFDSGQTSEAMIQLFQSKKKGKKADVVRSKL